MTPLQKIIEQQLQDFENKFGYYKEIFKANKEADALLNIYEPLKSFLFTCQRQIIEGVREEIEKNYIFAGNEKANEDNYCGGYNQALNDLQSKLKIE